MDEILEIGLDSPDGTIDCRLEPQRDNGILSYSATILYPGMINGYNRSEIFCYTMVKQGSVWVFDTNEDGIHPKIQKLEEQLAGIIAKLFVSCLFCQTSYQLVLHLFDCNQIPAKE
ncbi:MAG: hypothetical protein JWQ38_3708, partial [Flavipsychrobacter sp.]|nr:hypothetical protein [Flavipsychrobacter sp.]